VSRITDSLKKKIGPLPAWAWALVLAGGLYYYRKKTASSNSSTADTTSTTVPQASDTGTVLSPGESIVNPDGTLTTAPGSTSGDSSDPGSAIASAIAGLTAQLATDQTAQAQPTTPTVATTAPAVTASLPKLGSAKRKAKTKPAHTTPKPTTKANSTTAKLRARSTATVRNALGGRVGKPLGKDVASGVTSNGRIITRGLKGTATPPRRRSRPVVGLVGSTSAQQHIVATHPKASARPVAATNPPRPSAPPPRTTARPIAAKPAPKPARKRS
jgi:hypothetical protein